MKKHTIKDSQVNHLTDWILILEEMKHLSLWIKR